MKKSSKEDDFGWRLYYNPDVTDIDSEIKEIKINIKTLSFSEAWDKAMKKVEKLYNENLGEDYEDWEEILSLSEGKNPYLDKNHKNLKLQLTIFDKPTTLPRLGTIIPLYYNDPSGEMYFIFKNNYFEWIDYHYRVLGMNEEEEIPMKYYKPEKKRPLVE